MRMIENQTSTGSPVKHVDFQRGNSRVVSSLTLSPRNSLLRRRPVATPQKYRAALQQSRKPSNPIAKTKLDSIDAPKLVPPVSGSTMGEDDEWQDVEQQNKLDIQTKTSIPRSPSPKSKVPCSGSPRQSRSPGKGSALPRMESPVQNQREGDTTNTIDFTDGNTSTTTSFLGFSPSAAKASFMRKLERQSQKFKPSNWTFTRSNEPYTPESKMNGVHQNDNIYTPKTSIGSHKSFWWDPTTPSLLALYLQVGFNLFMVAALVYAIAMFYSTIRNDVNLKVEEYSVDIIDQIAKCSYEYLRNGCEPSKRVPAMEAACQQWDRCMHRDPKEVGRAKVSAETFGAIIEAFLKPIGIKSMVFLIGVFAGSFLLINAVFASRIGPRFSADPQPIFGNNHIGNTHLPPPPPPPSASHYQQPVQYPQSVQPSLMYSPSPRLASPRHRHSSIYATLQSSPIHRQSYSNYPY